MDLTIVNLFVPDGLNNDFSGISKYFAYYTVTKKQQFGLCVVEQSTAVRASNGTWRDSGLDSPSMAQKFWVKIGGKINGPYALIQLKQLAQQGQIKPDDEVSENQQTWVLASSVKGLSFPDDVYRLQPLDELPPSSADQATSPREHPQDDTVTYDLRRQQEEKSATGAPDSSKDHEHHDKTEHTTDTPPSRHNSPPGDTGQERNTDYADIALKVLLPLAKVAAQPFGYYYSRRQELWLFFAATSSLSLIERRQDLEAMVWDKSQDESGYWRVKLPQRCVTCGAVTDTPRCEEQRNLEDFFWLLWCPIIGLTAALPLLFVSTLVVLVRNSWWHLCEPCVTPYHASGH